MFPRTETEMLHFTFSPESLILLRKSNGSGIPPVLPSHMSLIRIPTIDFLKQYQWFWRKSEMQYFRLRARKHSFLLSFLKISEAGIPKFPGCCDSVPNAFLLCFKKVVRLDGCVAFSQIEPKTPNLEWENVVVASFPNGIRKSRKCHFSHYEIDGFEGSESALFRKINNVLRFKA